MKKMNNAEMRQVEGGFATLVGVSLFGAGIGFIAGWIGNHILGRPGW